MSANLEQTIVSDLSSGPVATAFEILRLYTATMLPIVPLHKQIQT